MADYGTLMEQQRQNARYSVAELRKLAVGMPYVHAAKKADILVWLREYQPESLADAARKDR